MPRLLLRLLAVFLALAPLATVRAGGPPASAPEGLLVVEARPGRAAQRAGARAGDRLVSWERSPSAGPARGELRSPLPAEEVLVEQGSRGGLVLHGYRGAAPLTLRPDDEPMGTRLAPACPDDVAAELVAAEARASSGRLEEARSIWSRTEKAAGEALLAWIALRQAEEPVGPSAAEALDRPDVRRALAFCRSPHERALALRRLGIAWLARGHGAAGARALSAAISLLEAEPPSLLLADCLIRLPREGMEAGKAEALVRRVVSIRDRLAPASHAAAHAHDALGSEYGRQGRFPATRAEYARAWDILRQRRRETALTGQVLVNLGEVRFRMGDIPAGPRQVEDGFGILERTGAGTPERADALRTLAIIARMTGNQEEAERRLRQGLALLGNAGGRDAVATLLTLANVQAEREDFRGARGTAESALEICRREGLDASFRALLTCNLANYEKVLGNRARAESLARDGIALMRSMGLSPPAEVLTVLAGLALERGDVDQSERWLDEARERARAVAPMGLAAAEIEATRGDVLHRRGDDAGAKAAWERALAGFHRLRPGTIDEARALQGLALVERTAGRRDRALELLRSALSRVDAAEARLGGSDASRLAFGTAIRDLFAETVDLLVEVGELEEALLVVERLRSRAFIDAVSQREALRLAGAPQELLDRRARNEFQQDAVVSQLSALDPDGPRGRARVAELTRRLEALREEHAALGRQAAAAAPRAALLGLEARPDLGTIRSRLPAGSTWLVYLVGETRTHLFIVGPGGGRVRHALVPAGAEDLVRQAAIVRSLLLAGGRQNRAGPDLEAALRPRLREAWDLLLAPAAPELAASRRLLLSLDGPLRALPFAALAPKEGGFLVERLPVDVIASGSSLVSSGRPGPAGGAGGSPPGRRILALGDPGSGGMPLARRLEPLPGARAEVARIARLFGPDSRELVGDAATEEEAMRGLPSARWAHFACHAVWNPADPVGSGLALAPSPRANGLLTVGEILSGPRLNADVVTLSACATATGASVGEDGVSGLVRAFQVAGARSVVASLWNVADASTADLMAAFYGGLARGLEPDRALREAQLALLSEPAGRYRHPFHWAGFVSFASAAASARSGR